MIEQEETKRKRTNRTKERHGKPCHRFWNQRETSFLLWQLPPLTLHARFGEDESSSASQNSIGFKIHSVPVIRQREHLRIVVVTRMLVQIKASRIQDHVIPWPCQEKNYHPVRQYKVCNVVRLHFSPCDNLVQSGCDL